LSPWQLIPSWRQETEGEIWDLPYNTGDLATLSTKQQLLNPQNKYHKVGKWQQHCEYMLGQLTTQNIDNIIKKTWPI